ncbi:hypothetical protein TRIUR3_20710 [Triticum urartu]|uniref:Uncharacterized protein n=2 Tax=Triticum TaxID=4564 RepID=A0A9R0Q617_TRITD|nr:hypothetical protein TRIUR3_20710 [Triticum urartu]VAH04275.1 unnamed protein product [Triticum turgidum subsp. durum]
MARAFFHTPQRQHHLAELRIEGDQSPIAFSDPCAAGRKRRCLFPAFSPRKKILVDLPPFSSAPAPSPPPSGGRTRKPEGSTLWSRRRGNKRQLEEQLQVTVPLKKVAKTEALAIGDPTRRAALSVSSTRPCCAFVNSPAKAINQEANKDILAASGASCSSSPYQSPAGTICTFDASPTRPLEKASKRESEGGDGHGAAACPGAEVVVCVTCSCGARKEFCFDHRH